MHEMVIAEGLLRQALLSAGEHQVTRINRIEVVTGVLRLVVPEALRMAFEVFSKGTIAEGAELRITEEPILARCRGCGREFGCEVYDFACPGCGAADVEFVAGNDIILKSMTCEQEEGASAE